MKRSSFYGGLFFLTFSTMALEIVHTRILSVITWYHLAFFVISAALFGMTAGAVWVYLRPLGPEEFGRRLARLTTAFAVSAVAALAVELTLGPEFVPSASGVVVFGELALVLAVPFFFSGAAVTLALTRSPHPVGTVYAVDLAGASLGCLGVLAILSVFDGPSAVVFIGGIGAFAGHLFSPGARTGASRPRLLPVLGSSRLVLSAALVVLSIINTSTARGLRPMFVKGKLQAGRPFLYDRWNILSRITAEEPRKGFPVLWGPSPVAPAGLSAEEIWMEIDGVAGTAMARFRGDFKDVAVYGYDLTNLVYHIRNTGDAAVLGVGGGRDVLAAKMFGLRHVAGVEINPVFIEMLTDYALFRRFAGLADLPGVSLVVDDARSWLARTGRRFDVVQMSMIDTWAAASTGAFSLTENRLYTVEAWRLFLDRLTDGGLLTVSRWHAPGEMDETGRMMSLAVACLLERGVGEPGRHVFLASAGNIATLLLGRSPLSAADIAALKARCREMAFEILLCPGEPAASPLLARIVASPERRDLDRIPSPQGLDFSPPTDDRPFFFNMVPLTRATAVLSSRRDPSAAGLIRGNLMAALTLLVTLVVSAGLGLAVVIVPFRPAVREAGRRLVRAGALYFSLLGLGFMFVEIGLIQRLSVFLGHPVYGLSVVLFGLILATGVGSALSSRLRLDAGRGRFLVWGLLLGGYLASTPWLIRVLFASFEGSPVWVKACWSTALILPAGLAMGLGFPTGLTIVDRLDGRPKPWFFGINGACGVIASVAAVAVSLTWGITVTLYLGAICYVLLVPVRSLMAADPD